MEIKMRQWKAVIMLAMAAIIWGFAFVAQRMGIQYIGSFTFTGVRFALGALSIIPLMVIGGRNEKKKNKTGNQEKKVVIRAGFIAGMVLYIGASLQQVGLEYTTAGKAAFITGFYIILVPALGILKKNYIERKIWIAALLSITGLYLISVKEGFSVSKGDLLVFICSFFFAIHILLINNFTQKVNTLKLSFIQYITCSVFCIITALFVENIKFKNIIKASIPLIYGGVFSVGIAYTLQAVGQKYLKASHAAIIMSLESVFALIGGILFLDETINAKELIGCLFMISGVILSQLQRKDSFETAIQVDTNVNHGNMLVADSESK